MKLTALLSHLPLLATLGSIASANPLPADPLKPGSIDLSRIGTHRPTEAPDTLVDHPIESLDLTRDESWAITVRANGSVVWVHQSRWHTVKTDGATAPAGPPPDLSTIKGTKPDDLEGRSQADYMAIMAGLNKCNYKSTIFMLDGCYSSSMFADDLITNTLYWSSHIVTSSSSYTPKVNVYLDDWCGEYFTSVLGEVGCVAMTNYFFSVLPFNQQL